MTGSFRSLLVDVDADLGETLGEGSKLLEGGLEVFVHLLGEGPTEGQGLTSRLDELTDATKLLREDLDGVAARVGDELARMEELGAPNLDVAVYAGRLADAAVQQRLLRVADEHKAAEEDRAVGWREMLTSKAATEANRRCAPGLRDR